MSDKSPVFWGSAMAEDCRIDRFCPKREPLAFWEDLWYNTLNNIKREEITVNQALMALVDDIRRLCDPCGVLLYGAKQALPEEGLREVNLCLIVKEDPKEAERMLYCTLDAEFAFNLLVYREDDWVSLVTDETSYASGIRKKGVLLYGKA